MQQAAGLALSMPGHAWTHTHAHKHTHTHIHAWLWLRMLACLQVVETRHRLKLLTPFLEHLIGEGTTDPHVHNALGECTMPLGARGWVHNALGARGWVHNALGARAQCLG